ncbi:hypothetical protein [uncultured Tateyamaria sp.]|uniref:hypothetical protein n=1 Tax=uncultured Tateyamaria sp. TaxID=455651 RepID=UPI002638CC65|nr:hypothetical protein [uncultured Tateyamaria sp.]
MKKILLLISMALVGPTATAQESFDETKIDIVLKNTLPDPLFGGANLFFDLNNYSSYVGDVLFWIEQDGREFCVHVTDVAAQAGYNMKMKCGELRSGNFRILYTHPATRPRLARRAKRS